LAIAGQPSAADIAQARVLLNQGLKLREEGDARGALEKLRAAHVLANTPITGIELGRTYLALGELLEARETFLSIDRIPPRTEETERSAIARREAAQLAEEVRPRIPSLTVRITGAAPDSVAVTIDGAAVPAEALGAPRLLNPGSHDVSARSTGGGAAETKVDLQEGESRDVELDIAVPDRTSAPAPPPADTRPTVPVLLSARESGGVPAERPSRTLAWSLLGGGGALAASGALLMVVDAAKARDANRSHDRGAYDSASTGWTVGLAGTLVGGAAFAGGGILLAATRNGEAGNSRQGSVSLEMGIDRVRLGWTW
jgi:hypothetical protein